MRLKVLQTDIELENYRKVTKEYIDTLLPLEYLKRSKVVACFDAMDNLCGGFVLVMQGPFRVIESIPEQSAVPQNINFDKVAEITGLWISKRFSQAHGSAGLWIRLFKEMLFCRKRHFVYAYSLRKPHLTSTYSVAKPRVLFRGETKLLVGMDEVEKESVEIFSIWNLLTAPFRRPLFLVKRRKKKAALKEVAVLKFDSST